MTNKIFLPLVLLLPHLVWAQRGDSSMMKDTVFIQGVIGGAAQGESRTAPGSVKDDQESEGATGSSFALGYKWQHFSMELIYTNFGSTQINFDDKYYEGHNAYFVGGGLHWTWAWFDLKVGWGKGNDKIKYTQGPNSTTFSADPNDQKGGGAGGYFGVGLNFDLGRRTEFIIDYTGYAWTQKDSQTVTVDGDTETNDEVTTGMGIIGIGLRRFF